MSAERKSQIVRRTRVKPAASPARPLPFIQIEVRLNSSTGTSLGVGGMAGVERELTAYLERVTADLTLPPASVRVIGGDPSSGRSAVAINGVACRMPVAEPYVSGLDVSMVSLHAARTIHSNRELLVDMRIADALRDTAITLDSQLTPLTRDALLQYLRRLVRSCLRIDKENFLTGAAPPSRKWSAETCHEEAARRIANLRLVLLVPPGAFANGPVDERSFEEGLVSLQDDLFFSLGVRFPLGEVREDPWLQSDQVSVQINDLRLPPLAALRESEFIVDAGFDRLQTWGIEARRIQDPTNGAELIAARGGANEVQKIRTEGIGIRTRREYLLLLCKKAMIDHAACFIVADSVEYELDSLKNQHPDIVAAVAERYPLAQVLRSLVEEGIAVKDLIGVFEALLAVKSTMTVDSKYFVFQPYGVAFCPAGSGERLEDVDAPRLAECVRLRFRRYISFRYSQSKNTLSAYVLDPAIELRIGRSAELPITDQERNDINDAVRAVIGDSGGWNAVILTFENRGAVKRLIERENPEVAVLSYEELSPDLNVATIARITLEPVPPPP
jgi:type III secretory pathway component EscV